MGCCGDREKIGDMKAEQKWDYINLDDFKSRSCWTPLSYLMLWIFALISIAVYAVDTFIAFNLLVYSRWAGQIKPAIPPAISRWIFAICIIISFVLLGIRWLHTIRVLRSGGVAESYLDPLAARVQSIRVGQGGWKRFLVYAELTKSNKGADYIALFSYFSFEAWLRIVFAEGPRQAVNAFTLYSVAKLDLMPRGKNAAPVAGSLISQFFMNLKTLTAKNNRQTVVLFGMLFTLIIWTIAVLSLLLSVVLYLLFLFHYIPSGDGSLKRYCRRKINSRLERIVRQKVNKALNKGVVLQDRSLTQSEGTGKATRPQDMAPTLPDVEDFDKSLITPLSRQPTQSTLPPYSRLGTARPEEKPGLCRQPTLPNLSLADDKPSLTRTTTQSSAFSSSTPVTGYSPLDHSWPSPVPPMPAMPSEHIPSRFHTPISRPTTAEPRATSASLPAEGPGRRTPAAFIPQSQAGRRTPAGPFNTVPSRYGIYDPAGGLPSRTLTLINTDVPRGDTNPNGSLTPSSRIATPGLRGNGGYAAFNLSMAKSRNLESGAQTPAPPSHRPTPITTPDHGYQTLPTNPDRCFTAPPSSRYHQPPLPNLPRPSTTAPHGERSWRPPAPGFSGPMAPSARERDWRPPTNVPRSATAFSPNGGGYRPPQANFSRPSTTPPSNRYGNRSTPNRRLPRQNNSSQGQFPLYDDGYEYGRAI